jgi:hypothetical protein
MIALIVVGVGDVGTVNDSVPRPFGPILYVPGVNVIAVAGYPVFPGSTLPLILMSPEPVTAVPLKLRTPAAAKNPPPAAAVNAECAVNAKSPVTAAFEKAAGV